MKWKIVQKGNNSKGMQRIVTNIEKQSERRKTKYVTFVVKKAISKSTVTVTSQPLENIRTKELQSQ